VIHYSFHSRGMESLRTICRSTFANLKIAVPDFICDRVLSVIRLYCQTAFYHINPDLTIDGSSIPDADVFYTIGYFGNVEEIPDKIKNRGIPVIRDGVWFPYPFSWVEPNEIWFNSFRKAAYPANGSLLIWGAESAGRLSSGSCSSVGDIGAILQAASHPERVARADNYRTAQNILWNRVLGAPAFPAVMALDVIDQRNVRERLHVEGIEMPGMWENHTGEHRAQPLYDTLMILPCDSRFNQMSMARRGWAIERACLGVKFSLPVGTTNPSPCASA
jgi:hypothetical protein